MHLESRKARQDPQENLEVLLEIENCHETRLAAVLERLRNLGLLVNLHRPKSFKKTVSLDKGDTICKHLHALSLVVQRTVKLCV